MRRVVVHIDRLALHGLARHDARAVTDALHDELAGLLGRPGTPLAVHQVPVTTVPALRLGAGSTPAALGRAAAGAVATAISGTGTGRVR